MVKGTRSTMSRVGIVVKAQSEYNEQKMSRRLALNLVASGIVLGSTRVVLFDKKTADMSTSLMTNGLVKYIVTPVDPSSSYTYSFFPILFIM